MENKEKIRQEIGNLDEDVRNIRELMNSTRRRMVEQINALCSHHGGEVNVEDIALGISDIPTVCYDGDGDNCCVDLYASVMKIKARRNKDWKKYEYDGFEIEVSSEMAYATLLDKELSYDEIESIFEFLAYDEILETIMDNE